MTAQEFKDLSAQAGLKPTVLSQTLGYTKETIARMRSGKSRVSHRAAMKLYGLLGIQLCPTCHQPLPRG